LSGRGVKLRSHIYVVPRLTISGVITTLPQILSCRGA
jgi:hypothetical protein